MYVSVDIYEYDSAWNAVYVTVIPIFTLLQTSSLNPQSILFFKWRVSQYLLRKPLFLFMPPSVPLVN